ncbi:hypothetical protein H0H81_007009, partial [Sphagnurus paluster]
LKPVKKHLWKMFLMKTATPTTGENLKTNSSTDSFFVYEGTDFDEYSSDEYDSKSEDEWMGGEELDELTKEARINHFNVVLFEAQAMAVRAEREAAGGKPKWKHHYTGNSKCTKCHHAQKRQELASTSQKFISAWFLNKEKGKGPKIDNSESLEVNEDEVEASMKQLFPGEQQVS